MGHILSVTCCRSLVFSDYFGFLRLHNKTDHHNLAEILLKVEIFCIKKYKILRILIFNDYCND
jgi:hypothetical protein